MRTAAEIVVIAVVAALTLRRGVFLVAALVPHRPLPGSPMVPSVTVLVAARNEGAVAEHLLASLSKLDYPADRLSFVFVCDGCTDDTATAFRRWAEGRAEAHVVELAVHVGKAAALNKGLELADGDVVVVIDADLRPRSDFLHELVPPFADEHVAAAAAFLRPANADDNVVTRYAAVTSWVHQLITSAGKDRLGLNPPTLGAAAYRRRAIEAIGGFPIVPAGVDVAASRRLTRQGWRTRFVPAAVVENTVVSEGVDYWRQHIRWARGVFRTPAHGRTPFRGTVPQRFETWAAAIGYGDRLVFLVAAVGAISGALPLWLPILYLSAPGLEILAASLKAGLRRGLPRVLLATVLLFAVDLVASLAAVAVHASRRPYRWQSPRHVPAGMNPNP
jgi:cellulose synthase/poly-beta-1,6-N-acetylglucosamine synthase-like glycosyltransferase